MSFCSETKSLSSGGSDPADRLGDHDVAQRLGVQSPSASALATCEGWTDSMPERYTSAT